MKKACPYIVTIEVEKLNGFCAAGHKTGDKWITDSVEKPIPICPVALTAIWQKIYAMLLGATFTFADEPDVCHFSCPDAGIVGFKISRKKQRMDKSGAPSIRAHKK